MTDHPLSRESGEAAGQEAERVNAPAATVMVVAVTDAASAPPMPYVPAVEAENVPKCVTATVPAVENVRAELFVLDDPEAAFHEHA
jgi:hypothetical protein